MSPIVTWTLALMAIAIVLFVSEVFIPSHGVLSVLATGCLVIAVVLCFMIQRWLGVGVMAALLLLGPVGLSLGVSVWQRTPVGRRMVLTATSGDPNKSFVLVGSVGTTLTELRPMGECEFDGRRVQARSELGRVIGAGLEVVVLDFADNAATVRPVAAGPSVG